MLAIDLDFAELDFRWNAKAGRYRITSGVGKGQLISRQAILNLTRESIESNKTQLVALADEVATGQLNLPDFQRESARLIRLIHTQNAAIARGGFDKVTAEDWLKVARNLKRQYKDGVDPDTGKRFGLKHLAQEIKDGQVTLPQLRHRLGMYANSGIESYWAMAVISETESGKAYGIRVLGATHEHCEECLIYSSWGPRPIDRLPLPTQACRCRTNCKCSILGLTLEQAVLKGMSQPKEVDAR